MCSFASDQLPMEDKGILVAGYDNRCLQDRFADRDEQPNRFSHNTYISHSIQLYTIVAFNMYLHVQTMHTLWNEKVANGRRQNRLLRQNHPIVSKRGRSEMQLLSRKMTVVLVSSSRETKADVRETREMVRRGSGPVVDDGLRRHQRTRVLVRES
jgi:hypothetical protein